MPTLNQEASFEVVEKNETVAVAVKTPSLAEQLPPLTPEQREALKTAHPSLRAQIECHAAPEKSTLKQQQTPPTFAYKQQPHQKKRH